MQTLREIRSALFIILAIVAASCATKKQAVQAKTAAPTVAASTPAAKIKVINGSKSADSLMMKPRISGSNLKPARNSAKQTLKTSERKIAPSNTVN